MCANALMIAFSATLLLYWYRYVCLLILSARSAQDYAASVARVNGLRFPEMQRHLAENAELLHLDVIENALERDYRLLTWLMRNGAEFRPAGNWVESRMLMLDYRIMRIWYSLLRRVSLPRGQQALQEMIYIVRHFAAAMGECTAAASSSGQTA